MSFAQTTSTEDIPTGLQNGTPRLLSLNDGTIINNVLFLSSKNLVFSLPYGTYLVCGSVEVVDTVPVGQWIALQIQQSDSATIFCEAYPSPNDDLMVSVCCPVTVKNSNLFNMNFLVACQSGGVRVKTVDLRFIKL